MVAVGGMGAGTDYGRKPKEEPEVDTKNDDGSNKSATEVAQELQDIADGKANIRMVASQMMADGNADRAANSADQNAQRLANSRMESDTTSTNGKIAANEVGAASQSVSHMMQV